MRAFIFQIVLSVLLLPAIIRAEPVISVPAGDSAALISAIASVPDGGIIELASGTYFAPGGGFDINTPNKSFTIRGIPGGTTTLSGNSTVTILRYINASPSSTFSVVFENLIFRDGRSTTNGRGGGITLTSVTATFLDCQFIDNTSLAPATGGGGVFLFSDSVVHFYGCIWQGNTAKNEGGGLRAGGDSTAFVHNSQFINNRVNIPDHRDSAAGGAIHVTNSRLRVTNTRFVGNEGVVGGAIYGLGVWDDPAITQIIIANSTFVDNLCAPDPSVPNAPNVVGGAIHSEDDVQVLVYGSRFYTNHADKGGAISQYRSLLEVHDSVFRGNFAVLNGGTITAGSEDANDSTTNNGAINRRSVGLTIHNTLLQGEWENPNPGPLEGGCVFVTGDSRRTYGLNGVSQMGNASINRATIDIRDSVFTDCHVTASDDIRGKGGALNLVHVGVNLQDSLIMNSNALANFGQGAGFRSFLESDLTISNTTFANNRASFNGAALIVAGSVLNMTGCQFFKNENLSARVGSAMVTGPEVNLFGFVSHEVSGTVQGSVFSNHPSTPVRDDDRQDGNPVNALQYNANQFFGATDFYSHQFEGTHSVAGLNNLIVTRILGGNTDKSPAGDNTALGSQPDLGALVAAPPLVFSTNAAGDPAPPTESLLGYAWCGDSASLNGSGLASNTGLQAFGSGIHTLAVGAETVLAEIFAATIPQATLSANPAAINSGETSDLTWSKVGTPLEATIDRGVLISTANSGVETIMPSSTKAYTLLAVTREGGETDTVKVFVDENPGLIFADGFESGDPSEWTLAVGF